jgi:hypothetical protein
VTTDVGCVARLVVQPYPREPVTDALVHVPIFHGSDVPESHTESFFKTLKQEEVALNAYETFREAEA